MPCEVLSHQLNKNVIGLPKRRVMTRITIQLGVSLMKVEDARALKVRRSVAPTQRGTFQDIALRSAVLTVKKLVLTRCPTPLPVLP